MNIQTPNIVWHQSKIDKASRNNLNNHKSYILWFTGLSGAGKSSIAFELEKELYMKKIRCYVLDGDNIRHGLNKNLGFSPEDRMENIRRIGEVSKLMVDSGLVVLTAFISPYKEDRESVRKMFPESEFIEIYVNCPIEECERRDSKGLYKKARAGEIVQFTGITAPYELPLNPEITLQTDVLNIEESVSKIMQYLEKNGKLCLAEYK
ncbi:MAG: adenylyl-sulfate kinase [Candidatus Pristimantibacillus sp.]